MDITIVIPGQIPTQTALQTFGIPSLEKLLVRGNVLESEDQTSIKTLFDQFGYDQTKGQELPVAAITALTDLENTEGKIWMRADPVFLHADLTSLLLFGSQSFSLIKEDAAGIFSILNPLLEEDGLCLTCGNDPSRWYLELKATPSITTTEPGVANGQDLRQFLPHGKDSAYWIRLSNEIQMLLHDCSINDERQRRGEVPINSVWFWGVGKLPDHKVPDLIGSFPMMLMHKVWQFIQEFHMRLFLLILTIS